MDKLGVGKIFGEVDGVHVDICASDYIMILDVLTNAL